MPSKRGNKFVITIWGDSGNVQLVDKEEKVIREILDDAFDKMGLEIEMFKVFK